jgi:hypothetical protein
MSLPNYTLRIEALEKRIAALEAALAAAGVKVKS